MLKAFKEDFAKVGGHREQIYGAAGSVSTFSFSP